MAFRDPEDGVSDAARDGVMAMDLQCCSRAQRLLRMLPSSGRPAEACGAVFRVVAESRTERTGETRLWDQLQFVGDSTPDLFQHVQLARDGGFSEVRHLYAPSRLVAAWMLLSMVSANVLWVLLLDIMLMIDTPRALGWLGGDASRADIVLGQFYLSDSLFNFLLRRFTNDPEAMVSPAQVIGFLEFIGLLLYLIRCMNCLVYLVCGAGGFRTWFRVQALFWEILPALSTYSAMQLLQNLVPLIYSAALQAHLNGLSDAVRHSRRRFAMELLSTFSWLCLVAFSGVVGFDAFLIRFRVVALTVTTTSREASIEACWLTLPAVQFLVQLLGVVNLAVVMRQRVFLFIFGGEDAVLRDDEVERMETWLALLARRMYLDLPSWQFVVVALSFSDADFQALVLNEDLQHATLGEGGGEEASALRRRRRRARQS